MVGRLNHSRTGGYLLLSSTTRNESSACTNASIKGSISSCKRHPSRGETERPNLDWQLTTRKETASHNNMGHLQNASFISIRNARARRIDRADCCSRIDRIGSNQTYHGKNGVGTAPIHSYLVVWNPIIRNIQVGWRWSLAWIQLEENDTSVRRTQGVPIDLQCGYR